MASFPDSPAWEDILLPAPPTPKEGGDVESRIVNIEKYLHSIFVSFMELNSALEAGWLIRDPRVISLTADKIQANTIFSQDLYLGSNKKIKLLGSQDLITVEDNQAIPQVRVRIGKLGTGNKQWGIEVMDDTGTVRFRASNITEIDGAVIKDATIVGAKILDGAVSTTKVATSAINSISKASAVSSVNILTITETSVLSITKNIFSTSSEVAIYATCSVQVQAGTTAPTQTQATLRLRRGGVAGTLLDTMRTRVPLSANDVYVVPVTFAYIDSGVFGSQTYNITAKMESTINIASATLLDLHMQVVEHMR